MDLRPAYTGVPASEELGSRDVPLLPYVHEHLDADRDRLLHEMQNGKRQVLRGAMCAVLHPDVRHLTNDHLDRFDWSLHGTNGDTHVKLHAPRERIEAATDDRTIPMVSSIISGTVYYPEGRPEDNPANIQRVLEQTGIIDPTNTHLPIVVQGGARISEAEARFARQVGYHAAITPDGPVKFITGSGGGTMLEPLAGAEQRQREVGVEDARRCGMTCGMIIAAEPTNQHVNRIALFPDMERRLEGFTRTGLMTEVHPGGAGTYEELLFLLAVALDERNKDKPVSYLLTGPEESGAYFEEIVRGLERIFGEKFVREAGVRDRLCIGTPEEAAARVRAELANARRLREEQMRRYEVDTLAYNTSLAVHDALRVRFQATRENVHALRAGTQATPGELLVALRQVFYTITCVTVGPERTEAEKKPYEITATPEVADVVERTLEAFIKQGRLNGDRFRTPLFKVVTI